LNHGDRRRFIGELEPIRVAHIVAVDLCSDRCGRAHREMAVDTGGTDVASSDGAPRGEGAASTGGDQRDQSEPIELHGNEPALRRIGDFSSVMGFAVRRARPIGPES
jgi:hypothetical protein